MASAAATGTSHAVRQRRKKLTLAGKAMGTGSGARIRPSLRSRASSAFHTAALGSSASCSSVACDRMVLRSNKRPEHDTHEFKCACCSGVGVPSMHSGRSRSNSTQFITTSLPEPPLAPSFFGLFGSIRAKELSQFQASFVQLRLAISDRAPDNPCDLVVLVSFHIVQYEDRTITRR